MTLDQLKMLIAVADSGSLRSASEQLNKTQAAVSQGIAKLENHLGLNLFNRSNYRLEISKEGQKILQHAQRVVQEALRLQDVAHHFASGNETEITVAFEASFDLSYLLPTLEITQATFPDTQIILKQHYISGAIQSVASGMADIAISPMPGQLRATGSFQQIPIYRGALIAVAASKLLDRHPEIDSVEQLKSEYQILVQDSGTISAGVDFGVKKGQRTWYVNDFSTKKMLIQSGMGWGTLPSFLVNQELQSGRLQKLSFEDAPSQFDLPYFVVANEYKDFGPVGKFLWSSLKNTPSN